MKSEICREMLDHFAGLARYWADLPDKTPLERCNGLVHSILLTLDGVVAGFEHSVDLVVDGKTINENLMMAGVWHKHESHNHRFIQSSP